MSQQTNTEMQHRINTTMFRSGTKVIKRVQNGDPLAWGQLVKEHTGRVFNLCYRFLGRPDLAEELTKESFISVYKHLSERHQVQKDFVPWILGMTRNLIIDHYRRTRDIRPAVSRGLEEDKALQRPSQKQFTDRRPGVAEEENEDSVHLHRSLQDLSPDLREAVILKDLEKFSCREIGAILNLPDATVRSRINRGRLELAKSLRHRSIQSQNASV